MGKKENGKKTKAEMWGKERKVNGEEERWINGAKEDRFIEEENN
jgi:hypothetical protein